MTKRSDDEWPLSDEEWPITGEDKEPPPGWQDRVRATVDGKPLLLHIDPAAMGEDMPDEQVDRAANMIHRFALNEGGDPAQAFCLMLAVLGEYIELTDAPVDLLDLAIEQLTEQRATLIAGGATEQLILKPAREAAS